MTLVALCNGRILAGSTFIDDHAVLLDGARIAEVVPAADIPAEAQRHDLAGDSLLPGFIDTQVNGGGGVLFNDAPTVETIRTIGAAHRQYGTTGFLPTLISDDLEVVAAALAAVDQGLRDGVPGLLGIHIEGPFLSTDRKGVHDPAKFLPLTDEHLSLLQPLASGVTMMTVAPEQADPERIRTLAKRGIIVSLGHSNATHAQTRAALEAGATGFTHLFNAMSPFSAREPGVIGTALDDQKAWCGLILDDCHVNPAILRIAFRARPLDRFMLVTDAMPTVGMAEKTFTLQGRRITVENGVCVTADGTLAGSDLEMIRAVRNCAAFEEVGPAEAVRMASAYPAAFLGLAGEVGTIAAGMRASLVAVDAEFNVVETWIDGAPSKARTPIDA